MADDTGPDAGGDRDVDVVDGDGDDPGDTFGVGVHVAAEEFRLVVHVPSDIDAGWTDPEAFQRRVEEATWELLDRDRTLRAVESSAEAGETVTLGTLTMRPDGTVTAHRLAAPDDDRDGRERSERDSAGGG